MNLSASIVSCGSEYTIILTVDGELMISGKLPFQIGKKDHLKRFEQLAKFEKSVQVK